MSMFGGLGGGLLSPPPERWNANIWEECTTRPINLTPNPSPPTPPFSPPAPREQRNSFHERAPQINEPIVVVMTSGEQLLPFRVFMDSVKKAGPFLPPNISTSYICISGSYQ